MAHPVFPQQAVQVASSILGPDVPVANIKVKPTDIVVGANSQVTGGSFGSDLVCHVSIRIAGR